MHHHDSRPHDGPIPLQHLPHVDRSSVRGAQRRGRSQNYHNTFYGHLPESARSQNVRNDLTYNTSSTRSSRPSGPSSQSRSSRPSKSSGPQSNSRYIDDNRQLFTKDDRGLYSVDDHHLKLPHRNSRSQRMLDSRHRDDDRFPRHSDHP